MSDRLPRALLSALTLLLALACGGQEEPAGAPEPEAAPSHPLPAPGAIEALLEGHPDLARARADLQDAPEQVRTQVLRLCDKWYRLDEACDPVAAHRDQLECWIERGAPILARSREKKLRQRATVHRTLLHQFNCMTAGRGWRSHDPGF